MDKMVKNRIILEFLSKGENVALARIAIASLVSQVELTITELEEIKVATSEAVSNAIIHGYENKPNEVVKITGTLYDDTIVIEIADEGVGIADIEQALKPAYSSDPERMGLGFVFMKSFMDDVNVESHIDAGTKVKLIKKLRKKFENKVVS